MDNKSPFGNNGGGDNNAPPFGGASGQDNGPPFGGSPAGDSGPPFGGSSAGDSGPPFGGPSAGDNAPPFGGSPAGDNNAPPFGGAVPDDGPPFGGAVGRGGGPGRAMSPPGARRPPVGRAMPGADQILRRGPPQRLAHSMQAPERPGAPDGAQRLAQSDHGSGGADPFPVPPGTQAFGTSALSPRGNAERALPKIVDLESRPAAPPPKERAAAPMPPGAAARRKKTGGGPPKRDAYQPLADVRGRRGSGGGKGGDDGEAAESYGTIPTATQKGSAASNDDGNDIYKDIPAKWAPGLCLFAGLCVIGHVNPFVLTFILFLFEMKLHCML